MFEQNLRLLFPQLYHIGTESLPVVMITGAFVGMVLALQSYTGFARFSAESAIPNVVVVSITRELGPVLAATMLAGLRCRTSPSRPTSAYICSSSASWRCPPVPSPRPGRRPRSAGRS